MLIYHYDDAGAYTGQSEARESPLEPEVFLLPALATFDEPPAIGEREAAVFEGAAWTVVPDWRGFVYWLPDRSRYVVSELGVEPPVGYLEEEPPRPQEEIDVELAAQARAQRDSILRNVYDVGVIWVQRELRLASGDAPRIAALNGKLAELDDYAVALQEVPEQPGFPNTINWPTQPTRLL